MNVFKIISKLSSTMAFMFGFVVASLSIIVGLSRMTENNTIFSNFIDAALTEVQEHRAELYYQNQKIERDIDTQMTFYHNIGANFPCMYGTFPLGLESAKSIVDGHKYGCGIDKIPSTPVVYSFGSNRQQDFEKSFLQYRPDAKIFVFEITRHNLPPVKEWDKRISYNNIGLGPPGKAIHTKTTTR